MREGEFGFIAVLDSKGRLRIPKTAITAKGYERGMKFDVKIVPIKEA